ncbi:hypothetical protein PNEG_01432 [Pneumocystis murina B123]|uniref:Mitochondrial carrier n=1 Tax=Pneumocystis murina (strain B123) TaxID=1069680 RepID=M7NN93_PNEMU|nr:hypothetical protein PNEG_01432 [Pneumocystis murina B123]EMR10158.1 hypothetical protein PNEG_01432 [Pneumocystis murina B123]
MKAYKGFYNTLLRIWFEEGIRGFYRGLGPLMAGYFPTWGIYFTIYERCKDIYGRSYNSESIQKASLIVNMKSAITAGSISSILTNPIWIVKTRLMSQNSHSYIYYRNTFDAFRKMYTNEGIFSFYKGLVPSLIGVTHVAIQFPLYEFLKDVFFIDIVDFEKPLLFKVVLASVISKMVAGSITYPHEVIRTRIQTQMYHKDSPKIQYRGVFHTFCRIYYEEGWKSFYSGMGTNLIRTVPVSMVMLLTFEILNKWLFQIKHRHHEYIN